MGDSADDFDVQLKILLIGDSGVGKSSLLLRFTDRRFDDLTPTIGTTRYQLIHATTFHGPQAWTSRLRLCSTRAHASSSPSGTPQARNAFAHSRPPTTAAHTASSTVRTREIKGGALVNHGPLIPPAVYDVTRAETLDSISDIWYISAMCSTATTTPSPQDEGGFSIFNCRGRRANDRCQQEIDMVRINTDANTTHSHTHHHRKSRERCLTSRALRWPRSPGACTWRRRPRSTWRSSRHSTSSCSRSCRAHHSSHGTLQGCSQHRHRSGQHAVDLHVSAHLQRINVPSITQSIRV